MNIKIDKITIKINFKLPVNSTVRGLTLILILTAKVSNHKVRAEVK